MINSLPDNLLCRVIAASYREVITRICKRWHGLGKKIDLPSLVGQREVFRSDLYSWFQSLAHTSAKSTFNRFDAAVEYKNWPAVAHIITHRRRYYEPVTVEKAVADLVCNGQHKKIEALITAFPDLLPKISINNMRNYNGTAEMMYKAGYITVKSPLILELLKNSYTSAVNLVCEGNIRPDECDLSAETILSIIAWVSMPESLEDMERVIFGLRELAAICASLLAGPQPAETQ